METSIQQYKQAVSDIKGAILQSQYRTAKLVTGEQLSLYFGIGGYISYHARQEKWGTSAVNGISEQLRRELPGLRGFSSQNIRNMRSFYEYWAQYLICSPLASKFQVSVTENVIDIDAFALQKWSPKKYFPEVGLSSKPRMLSKVDLPQPDGPMMATNSPSSTVKDTLLSAIVSTSSVRNDLLIFSTLIIFCQC
jgi:hypothetical protein